MCFICRQYFRHRPFFSRARRTTKFPHEQKYFIHFHPPPPSREIYVRVTFTLLLHGARAHHSVLPTFLSPDRYKLFYEQQPIAGHT